MLSFNTARNMIRQKKRELNLQCSAAQSMSIFRRPLPSSVSFQAWIRSEVPGMLDVR
jgi:hypothetical protein